VSAAAFPLADELTEPWWRACAEGRLTVQRCSACGTRFFVPETVCPSCWSAAWEWVPSEGVGEVYSYTVVERAASPNLATPYVLAIVDLDDGWTMMSNLVGCDPADVEVAMRVAVRFEAREGAGVLPVFAPSHLS
jgi:uncharacterized OB-fold protein